MGKEMKGVGLGCVGRSTRWQQLALRLSGSKQLWFSPLCYIDHVATDAQVRLCLGYIAVSFSITFSTHLEPFSRAVML